MRLKNKLALCGMMIALAGCAATGPQPAPSKLDNAIFSIQTNTVTLTNLVTQTNLVQQVMTTTNVQNQVVFQTNVIPLTQIVPQVVTQTNYVYTPKESVTNTVNTVGAMTGPWGAVGGIVAAFALGIWGKVKSRQLDTMTDVAGSAQQAIATAQKVISAMPNGASYAATFNGWLSAHQNDVDIAQEIAQTVNDYVDHPNATTAAAGIVATALKPIIVPAVASVATAPAAPKPVAA